VTVEVASDVRSVVAVHFRRGERAAIERAASAAGQPLAKYIRNAAAKAARLRSRGGRAQTSSP
jgi:hypothetical protein